MSKVAKSALGLMIVTILSKVIGFLRETILVSVHGASATADAYITALNIPTVLFAIIGTALATTFIPLYFQVEKEKGKDGALKFANNIFNIVIILSIILSILGFIFAEPLTKVFAIDFTGEKLKIATNFTKVMIWGMIFIGLNNIMTAWLQIKGNFTIPGMVALPSNICIIYGIILSANGNLKILGILSLLGMVSQFLFQLPFAYKSEYRYKFYIDFKDPYLKRMLILILPVCIGVGVNQLNAVVDRTLASTLGDGIITILNSANKLNFFVLGIFISTISAVIYPMLSRLSSSHDKDNFSKAIQRSISSVVIIMLPISAGAILLSNPIVKIVFERGKFTPEDTIMTATILSCYAIGMIAFGLREILNQVFYSINDTKTPMINGAFAMIINIILNLLLIKILGYKGLALATSISAIIGTALLFYRLKKKIQYYGQDKIINTFVKSFVAVIIMSVCTRTSYNLLVTICPTNMIGDIISTMLSILIGALVYGVTIVVMRIEEVNMIIDMIKSKINKGNSVA